MRIDAKPVTQYEKEKRNGVSVITTAIIAAMGVNFVVAGITTGFYECSSCMFVIIGIIEIILALILFYSSQFKFNRNVIVKGFLVYNRDNKEILPISYYEISIWMFCELKSFCSHNEELSRLWNSHYIGENKVDREKGRICSDPKESDHLLIETIEYCVLEMLSCSLKDYLGNKGGKIKTKKLHRNDIKDIVDGNRVLDWISDDTGVVSDKDIMLDLFEEYYKEKPDKEKINRIAKKMTIGKPSYAFLEFILPHDTLMKRNDDNSIEIYNKLFSIIMNIEFSGCSSGVPQSFLELYLDIDKKKIDERIIRDYEFIVKIDIKFKLQSLLNMKFDDTYNWIDNFLCMVNDYVSKESYFERIGWNNVEIIVNCLKNRDFGIKEHIND